MKKKLLSVIFTVTVSCTMFFASNVVSAATLESRLYGNDRYQTNSKIIESGWTSSEYAVIASGEGFADALCAAPLAQQYKAPILLTDKSTLSAESKSQLLRISAKKVFIIGGTAVVSDNVKSEIESMGIKTTRIYGQNRFETSIEVAKNIKNITGVVIVNGFGFADSLSIAPIAAQKGMPILLTDKSDLSSVTKDFLANKTLTENYIIGGTGVVGSNIDSYLNSPTRLGGNSRYETNAAVLNYFADKFSYEKVYVASGENYPDALSGSVLAASNNSPLILVGKSLDSSVMASIKNKHDKYNNIIVLGGTKVVPDALANSVVNGNEELNNNNTITPDQALDSLLNNLKLPGYGEEPDLSRVKPIKINDESFYVFNPSYFDEAGGDWEYAVSLTTGNIYRHYSTGDMTLLYTVSGNQESNNKNLIAPEQALYSLISNLNLTVYRQVDLGRVKPIKINDESFYVFGVSHFDEDEAEGDWEYAVSLTTGNIYRHYSTGDMTLLYTAK